MNERIQPFNRDDWAMIQVQRWHDMLEKQKAINEQHKRQQKHIDALKKLCGVD